MRSRVICMFIINVCSNLAYPWKKSNWLPYQLTQPNSLLYSKDVLTSLHVKCIKSLFIVNVLCGHLCFCCTQRVMFTFQVRRASAKCIEAIVSTRHEYLADFYKNVSSGLIARFKVSNLPIGPTPKSCSRWANFIALLSNQLSRKFFLSPKVLFHAILSIMYSRCDVLQSKQHCQLRSGGQFGPNPKCWDSCQHMSQ